MRRSTKRQKHGRTQVASLEPRRLLAGIGLDRFLGVNGVGLFQTSPEITPTTACTVAALPDGGFVVAGTFNPLIVKLDPSGVPDPSFGTGGFVKLPPTSPNEYPQTRKIIPLASGGFLLAATGRTQTSGYDFAFYRFLSNGQPDPSFGTGGVVIAPVPASQKEVLSDAIVLSDGTIVGVGSTYNGNRDRAVIIRLRSDGTPDDSTPGGAIQIFEINDGTATIFSGSFLSLLPLPGEDYLVAGGGASSGPPGWITNLRRFAADGSPVTSFGAAGIVRTRDASSGNMMIVPGGQVLMQTGFELTRFDPGSGLFDLTYGRRTLVPDPPQAAFVETVVSTLTHQGNLAVLYKGTQGLTAGIYTLDGLPVTTGKSATAPSVPTASSDRLMGLASLGGDQLIGVCEFAAGAASNRPVGFVRFNVFENQPVLLDDGTDTYHLRLNDSANNASVRVENSELVAVVDGIEHRVSLSTHRRLLISDAGGNDTIAIGNCADLDIDLDADLGNDLIRLEADVTAASLHILAGEGDDRVEMRLNSAGAPVAIDTLTIDLEAGTDAIELVGTEGDDVITLDESLSPSSSLRATVFGLEVISIQSGAGEDLVRLKGYPLRVSLTVDGGADDDTIEAALVPNGFNNPEATLLGGEGNDEFVFSPLERKYYVDGGDGTDRLRFVGSSNADTLNLLASERDFTFIGSGTATVRSASREAVVYDGREGIDRLTINDSAAMTGSSYVVTATSILRNGLPVYESSNHESVSVVGGSGDDSFVASGLFDLSFARLDGGAGSDALTLDESGQTLGRAYAIGATLSRDGKSISYGGFEQATLLAGSGNDALEFIPSATVLWTLEGGSPTASPGDTLAVRIAAVSSPLVVEDSPGNGRVTSGNRQTLEYRGFEGVRLVAPAVLSASFQQGTNLGVFALETPAQAVPPGAVPLVVDVVHLTTGQPVPHADLLVSNSGNNLIVSLKAGVPRYADGDYRITLHASQLRDAMGNAFAPDFVLDFQILAGDANGDRKVSFDDLLIVAQNYGRFFNPGSFGYARGELNGDGRVNFDDLLILMQNYGETLAIGASSTRAAGSLRARTSLASTVMD